MVASFLVAGRGVPSQNDVCIEYHKICQGCKVELSTPPTTVFCNTLGYASQVKSKNEKTYFVSFAILNQRSGPAGL